MDIISNDKKVIAFGVVLIGLLCLAMAIVCTEEMTQTKSLIYAICFWIVDIYWGSLGIICLKRRIGDMLRGDINSKQLTGEFVIYAALILLPLACFAISLQMWNH